MNPEMAVSLIVTPKETHHPKYGTVGRVRLVFPATRNLKETIVVEFRDDNGRVTGFVTELAKDCVGMKPKPLTHDQKQLARDVAEFLRDGSEFLDRSIGERKSPPDLIANLRPDPELDVTKNEPPF